MTNRSIKFTFSVLRDFRLSLPIPRLATKKTLGQELQHQASASRYHSDFIGSPVMNSERIADFGIHEEADRSRRAISDSFSTAALGMVLLIKPRKDTSNFFGLLIIRS